MECITGIQDFLCILWSFHLISYSYKLTVMGALHRPSLFGARSSHSGGVHNDSTLGQCYCVLPRRLYAFAFQSAFASAGSFVGPPDRGQFSVDPVFCRLLMILVTVARLPCRFSRLKAFNICTG